MANHILLRRVNSSIVYFANSRRTYHVLSKRTRGKFTRVNHPRLVLPPMGKHNSSSRLFSTSKKYETNVTGNENDLEMFRETPSFPPEWTNPTTDAVASSEVSDSIADIVTQNPEVVTSTIGGYTPVGIVQTGLEFVHSTLHLPWWVTIASTTIAIRLALFPLAVKMQVNAAKIANINPQAQVLHKKLMEYKMSGDKTAEAEQGMKLLKLYQENNCHPAKMFIMPFAQMPVFISFFMALRGMARLPVESFKTGGTMWFTDLTVPDPTYVLPLIACVAFLSNVEVGMCNASNVLIISTTVGMYPCILHVNIYSV